ncbi:Succinyl-CoA ligase [ADP-forming] subunit beta [Mannheimia haemolytica]|uniref:Succinyl-CoA ligase [ADP-forming] subunit beta n=1 Tax=Mannheimia haemolytica TaxID=75985 RepID=A0A378N1C6_MANHA|nr:Succinyl-CoA ligase [ADP-forming] subunit beta [Mannheimia haemolytica]
MNLHEYQAKQIFKQYGLPVSQGIACKTAEEAVEAIKQLQGEQWAIKCQVHAGGVQSRGVKLVRNEAEVREFADKWLGKRLVTFQPMLMGNG